MTQFTIESKELRKALTLTSFCMASSGSLSRVHFEGKGNELTVVVTDGHRMSEFIATIEMENEDSFSFSLPKTSIKTLMSTSFKPEARALVSINLLAGRVEISYKGQTVVQALGEFGNFPDYKMIIEPTRDYKADDGGDDNFGLRPIYLADACKAISKYDETVQILWSGKNTGQPILIKTKIQGFTHVIMPKRY